MIITGICLVLISKHHLRKRKLLSGKHQMQATLNIKVMAQIFQQLEVELSAMLLKCSSSLQVKEIQVLITEESNILMISSLKFSNKNLHQEVLVAQLECREFSKSWTTTQAVL